MRYTALLLVTLSGCASSTPATRADPAASPSPSRPAPGEPEIVKTGKSFLLGASEASARYGKRAPCGGADSPEVVIGTPDQKNEMQVGRQKVITYGFRFPEGTLLVRCQGDRVEVTRLLK